LVLVEPAQVPTVPVLYLEVLLLQVVVAEAQVLKSTGRAVVLVAVVLFITVLEVLETLHL
jgi:hypothetical protein